MPDEAQAENAVVFRSQVLFFLVNLRETDELGTKMCIFSFKFEVISFFEERKKLYWNTKANWIEIISEIFF